MGKACGDLLDVVPETVILAFDVAGWSDSKDAARIARSKAVVQAINKELAKQGKKLTAKHFSGQTVTQADAMKFLAGPGGKFLENRKSALTKRLSCAYNHSPLGVWLDKNSWVLYVFAPLLVGAAGTWMYSARIGDAPAAWGASMANVKKSWKSHYLGKITLGSEDVKFVPSKRELSGNVSGQAKWERLKIKMTLGAGMSDGSFKGVDLKTKVTTTVQRDLTLGISSSGKGLGAKAKGQTAVSLNYKGGGAGSNLALAIAGNVAYDAKGVSGTGGSASAMFKGKMGGLNTSVGVEGKYNRNFRPGDPANQYDVMLKLQVDMP